VRHLTTKDQFIALLYGQLSGAASLREIVGSLESHSARLYYVGGHVAKRSTLSDANALRPSEVFSGLFAEMAARAAGPAPQTRRRHLSDRCDQPSPERHGFGLCALLVQVLRRQGACHL